MDVLSALRFGNRQVTAVEINPVIAQLSSRAICGLHREHICGPESDAACAEGRNFAAGSPDTYDLITITMIDRLGWRGRRCVYVQREYALHI